MASTTVLIPSVVLAACVKDYRVVPSERTHLSANLPGPICPQKISALLSKQTAYVEYTCRVLDIVKTHTRHGLSPTSGSLSQPTWRPSSHTFSRPSLPSLLRHPLHSLYLEMDNPGTPDRRERGEFRKRKMEKIQYFRSINSQHAIQDVGSTWGVLLVRSQSAKGTMALVFWMWTLYLIHLGEARLLIQSWCTI